MTRVIFTKAPGAISWLIRTADGGNASHVGIQVGINLVISAEGRGVVEQSVPDFMEGRSPIDVYELTPWGRDKLYIEAARSMLKSKYDFTALPGFLWAKVAWWWFKKKVSNPLASPTATVCSEFLVHCARSIPEFAGLSPETTGPSMLHKRFLAGGPTFTRVPKEKWVLPL